MTPNFRNLVLGCVVLGMAGISYTLFVSTMTSRPRGPDPAALKQLVENMAKLEEENKSLKNKLGSPQAEAAGSAVSKVHELESQLSTALSVAQDATAESERLKAKIGGEPDAQQDDKHKELLCKKLKPMEWHKQPDEFLDWEIPVEYAVKFATKRPKLVCRKSMTWLRLKEGAPHCPNGDGSPWSAEMEEDFLNSKQRRLASNCGSWCLYSQNFGDQVAYLWTKPADCWQRVDTSHPCLTEYRAEYDIVSDWLMWDSCHDYLQTPSEASEGAADVDLNELSNKFHSHVGQPNRTEAFHIGAGANVVTVGNPHFYWDSRHHQWVRRQPVSGRAMT